MNLDKQCELAAEEIEPHEADLCGLARQGFAPVLAVPRLERANRAAGHA